MPGRYDNIQQTKNEQNQRVRRSVLMPTIQPSLSDIYVITTLGDRLDNLAHKYYGNVSYWWIIAQANSDSSEPIGKGTMVLPIKIQLRIPTNPVNIIQEFEQLNRL